MGEPARPVAVVTGAGRRSGLGAAIGVALADSGWDVALTYWSAYDAGQPWGADVDGPGATVAAIEGHGARGTALELDLTAPEAAVRLFDYVEATLGPVAGLVLNHALDEESGLLDTTDESFRRHFQVNVLVSWQLIRVFAERVPRGPGGRCARGRMVSLTSDHTVGNLPYGATKAAADRVVLAAARELAHLGVTANVVNPGPVDTGWMNDDDRAAAAAATPLGRLARPADVAHLVAFLFSEAGGWISAQLLHPNGGLRPTIP